VKTYLRHPLSWIWALLTAGTVASWAVSRDGQAVPDLNTAVTVSALLIAAIKAQLVVYYFMEVRDAPRWLRRTLSGWLILLFAALFAFYFAKR